MISRPLRWAAQGAAVAVVAVGAVSMAQYDKAVSLSLDGQASSVHVFGSTVGDLLAKQDLQVGAHDIVQPAVDAPPWVEDPAAGEGQVGHGSRPAGRRASVAANAATVRSTSASVCTALRKPDP